MKSQNQQADSTSRAGCASTALRPYFVRIIDARTRTVVRSFESFAPDSVTCVNQHTDLLEHGEKLDVMGLDAWRQLQREHKALVRQIQAVDQGRTI